MSGQMPDSFVALTEETEAVVQRIGTADILVGIPSFNNADTIGHVVRAVSAGLAKYFPEQRAVLVNSDGGSADGTPDVVAQTLVDFSAMLISEPPAILATIGISRAAERPVTYFGVTAASSMTMPADFPPALTAWAAISSTWEAASFAMAATSSRSARRPLIQSVTRLHGPEFWCYVALKAAAHPLVRSMIGL